MTRKIWVFDTTLRDGEQVPGAKLNLQEKLDVAKQLKKLQVDIIEAGFPASSAGDFQAVKEIAKQVGDDDKMMITALGRAVKADIDAVYNSVKFAKKPMIHIVLGTSNIHVEKKFGKSKDQILNIGVEAVKYAKTLLPEVQYSTEDASRSDFEYLWKTIESVVKAGATMINVPDTVGFAEPEEFGYLIHRLNDRLKNVNDKVLLSVHCHNDLGLATANTLAAIKNGADKVECTINGIGERAGNAALEEVVMAAKTRATVYDIHTNINTHEIMNTSRLVRDLMGLEVQVNKAITGENAFAHSSGIHQDGLLKSRDAYEIINPIDVGLDDMELVLTARSGRHAFKHSMQQLGFEFTDEQFEEIFADFLTLADAKKEIYNNDLYILVENFQARHNGKNTVKQSIMNAFYELVDIETTNKLGSATVAVTVKKGTETMIERASGDDPLDTLYQALIATSELDDIQVNEYKVNQTYRSGKAVANVSIQVKYKGKTYSAKATDADLMTACAQSFINVINNIVVTHLQAVS